MRTYGMSFVSILTMLQPDLGKKKGLQGGSYNLPVDSWRNNNVIITSKRRCDVVLT